MPIEPIDPPIAAYEAVRARIAELAITGAFRTPKLRRTSPDALAIAFPHRVAQIPLDMIRTGMELRSAALDQGWRFLLVDNDRAIAAATAIQVNNEAYRFGYLNEGPFVEGTERAVEQAEADNIIQQGHFEPLLLMVPALYVMALWLKDRIDTADLVLPITPTFGAFTSTLFPVAGFWSVLVRLANDRPPEPTTPAAP
jgi:hypothetical protein